jgi:hypothetical protein
MKSGLIQIDLPLLHQLKCDDSRGHIRDACRFEGKFLRRRSFAFQIDHAKTFVILKIILFVFQIDENISYRPVGSVV